MRDIEVYELPQDTNKLSEKMMQFIRNYITTNEKISPLRLEKEKGINALFSFLEDPQHTLIKEVCLTPEGAKLVCDKWSDSPGNNFTGHSIRTKFNIFYEQLLHSAITAFLVKCRDKPTKDFNASIIYRWSKKDLAFMEYYAFLLMHGASSPSIKNICDYLEDNSLSFELSQQFGFIKEDEAAPGQYCFCHPSFLYFFCTRFLISCFYFQDTIKNDEYPYQYPYPHKIEKIFADKTLKEYLQLKSQDKSYYPVWEWLEILLESCSDKETLNFFQSLIPKNAAKLFSIEMPQLLSESIQAINECTQSKSQFSLHRQENDTLVIRYEDSNDSLWPRARRFIVLKDVLNKWLALNDLKNEVEVIPEGKEIIELRIKATSETIGKILSWFTQITAHLVRPFGQKSPAFFALFDTDNLNEEEKSIGCRLQ